MKKRKKVQAPPSSVLPSKWESGVSHCRELLTYDFNLFNSVLSVRCVEANKTLRIDFDVLQGGKIVSSSWDNRLNDYGARTRWIDTGQNEEAGVPGIARDCA